MAIDTSPLPLTRMLHKKCIHSGFAHAGIKTLPQSMKGANVCLHGRISCRNVFTKAPAQFMRVTSAPTAKEPYQAPTRFWTAGRVYSDKICDIGSYVTHFVSI